MRLPILLSTVAVLSFAWAGNAEVAEVYKWVDEDGVVHYSDSKPEDGAPVATLQFKETNAQDYDPATDPYSILSQAKRFDERWTELTIARQEREQQQTEHARPYRNFSPSAYDTYAYYPPIAYFPRVTIGRSPHHQPRAALRQLGALEELDLVDRRPHSINSGAHGERVSRSANLPVVTPPRAPR